MPDISTLEHIADIVIRRTITDFGRGSELIDALERAYPFPEGHHFRDAWTRALRRQGIIIVPLSTRATSGTRRITADEEELESPGPGR
jgi:hypothetical protein